MKRVAAFTLSVGLLFAGALFAAVCGADPPGAIPLVQRADCGCDNCDCGPGCACELQLVQIERGPPAGPHDIWHPSILDAGKETAAAAKSVRQLADKASAVLDGSLAHAFTAGLWSAAIPAFAAGIVVTLLFLLLTRARPPK